MQTAIEPYLRIPNAGFSRRRIVGVFAFLLVSSLSFAQLNRPTLGGIVSTNGVGICANAELGDESIWVKGLYVNLQTLKHNEEAKVQNILFTNPKPYVYGKLNSAAALRFGYAMSRPLSSRANGKPQLFLGVQTGASLAITKPYLVRYQSPVDDNKNAIIVQQSEEVMRNQENIYGPAGWARGFSEVKNTPGFHLAINLSVNWNESFHYKKWDVGVQADFYTNSINLLYNADKQIFAGIYTRYSWGVN